MACNHNSRSMGCPASANFRILNAFSARFTLRVECKLGRSAFLVMRRKFAQTRLIRALFV